MMGYPPPSSSVSEQSPRPSRSRFNPLGFAGAFRRSERCSMIVSDFWFSASEFVINLPRSKADQEQAGEKPPMPHVLRQLRLMTVSHNCSSARACENACDRHG